MTSHVGIYPSKGEVAVYNGIISKFKVICVDRFETTKVDLMFDELRSKIQGSFGCLCIYLQYYYNNVIRKAMIDKAKEIGFCQIHILDILSCLYMDIILSTKHKPKNEELFLIFMLKEIYIWKIINFRAELVKLISYVSLHTEEDVLKIKSITQDPNIIIYEKAWDIDLEFINHIFPRCKTILNDNRLKSSFAELALIKARTMANDPVFLGYDVNAMLDNLVTFCIGEEQIEFKFGKTLPFEMEISRYIPLFSKDSLWIRAFIYEDTNIFEDNNRMSWEDFTHNDPNFMLKIDENRIFSVNYTFTSTKIGWNDLNIQKYTLYNIPEKSKVANINFEMVGIDFGMSQCCAAIYRQNGIETVALGNTGERQLPSFVAFDEKNPKCGKEVMRRLENYSKYTVFDLKRIIGKRFYHIQINENWPFKLIYSHGEAMIEVHGNDKVINLRPEDVAAILLKQIKNKSEEFQGKEIVETVITVPVMFNEKQKQATRVAAELAGFKTVHLLAEPIAGAIAYFNDRPIPPQFTVLLFDMGGGTLDLCIFKITNQKINVINIGGNQNLGRRDFDNILFDHFAFQLLTHYQVDVFEKERSKYKLLGQCIDIKENLSTQNEHILNVSEFKPSSEDFLTIKRTDFEKLAENLLKKMENSIIECLAGANFISSDIHKVLLVGGGSQMPMIKRLLQEMFSDAEHLSHKNPDELVAKGAAYYAYCLKTQKEKNCSIM